MSAPALVADMHVHTARCGHASGALSDYVARAREIGLRAIGFADHLPLVDREMPGICMAIDEIPAYVAEVRQLAGEVQEAVAGAGAAAAAVAAGADGFAVRLGIEADFIPGTESRVLEMLDEHPFDYVLGSVHFLGDWPFDHPDHRDRYDSIDPDDFWEEYFEAARAAAESGLFDVLAHPDLAKKFGVFPDADPAGLYSELASVLARRDMVVEINTAGLAKPVGEIYPGRELLAACQARGVPISLGSDAHAPADVGRCFGEAIALARAVGYREAVTFTRRQAEAYPLPEIGAA